MNYNQKLTSLAQEYEATMNHANEVMNEIIATAFEQAMVEAFNELTPEEQMALIKSGREDEIPKDKPIYVHCHSGLRSYLACRILTGNGYDCYNLAGGWRLYESVINERTVPEYSCKDCK